MAHVRSISMQLLAGVIALGATTPASAITNGQEDTADWNVVAVIAEGHPACTGVLVAPRVVATAAHCAALKPSSVFFGFSPAIGGTVIPVVHVRVHPSFQRALLRHDLSLLLLAEPAPALAEPARMLDRGIEAGAVGSPLRLVGFGHTSSGGDGEHLKREGLALLDSIEALELRYTPDPSMTCLGDSGGPAFIALDGVEYLAGITSYGDIGCNVYGGDTRIDPYVADFVTPYLAATADGAANVGDRCFHAANCVADATCAAAATGFRYCTAACTSDAACPNGMGCRDNRCAWDEPRGVAGSACTPGGLDCADGYLCGTTSRDAIGTAPYCMKSCSFGPVASCDDGWACGPALAEADAHESYACQRIDAPTPPPPADAVGGCSTTSTGSSRSAMASIALAIAALAVIRRCQPRSRRRIPC